MEFAGRKNGVSLPSFAKRVAREHPQNHGRTTKKPRDGCFRLPLTKYGGYDTII